MLTLILNAELYAPARQGLCHLLVGGERILWIGRDADQARSGAVSETVDLAGRRVVPGFIDGHAHITGGGGESGFASRVPPVPPSQFTRHGVTSVVGVLGTDDTTRNTASLLAQARGLREEGLSAWCHCGGYHLPPVTVTGSVRGDIVSCDPIIGVGELAISDHRSSQPTRDELLRIAGDAHVAGLMTGKAGILHLHLGDGARGLELVRQALAVSELPARVFNPTHVNRQPALFEEALDLARRGSTVDVTAYPQTADDPGIPAAEAVRRYLSAGAPANRITVSSDGGGCLPIFSDTGELLHMDIGSPAALADCLRDLLAGGLDLAAALPPFTSNVATLLRLRGKGVLEVGADADLLVLDDAARVTDVMARGRWHRRDSATILRGQFEKDPG